MAKTPDNLAAAFAGESQANRKYLFFAEKADADGLPNVARLFRAAAHAETRHAFNHFEAMGGLGSTSENLQKGIDGETHEFKEMYPEFLEAAKEEKNGLATVAFTYATSAEQVHATMYREAKEAVDEGKDLPPRKIFVCRKCGHTCYDEAPDKCPVCSRTRDWFDEIQ